MDIECVMKIQLKNYSLSIMDNITTAYKNNNIKPIISAITTGNYKIDDIMNVFEPFKLELFKELLENLLKLAKEKKINPNILNTVFVNVCGLNCVKAIELLLELKDEFTIDVHYAENKGFINACGSGCIEAIQLLLNLDNERKINVHYPDNEPFKSVCRLITRENKIKIYSKIIQLFLNLEGERYIDPTPFFNKRTIFAYYMHNYQLSQICSQIFSRKEIRSKFQEHYNKFIYYVPLLIGKSLSSEMTFTRKSPCAYNYLFFNIYKYVNKKFSYMFIKIDPMIKDKCTISYIPINSNIIYDDYIKFLKDLFPRSFGGVTELTYEYSQDLDLYIIARQNNLYICKEDYKEDDI